MSRSRTAKEERTIKALVKLIQQIDRNTFLIISPLDVEEIIKEAAARRDEDPTTWVGATLMLTAALEAHGHLLPRLTEKGWRR